MIINGNNKSFTLVNLNIQPGSRGTTFTVRYYRIHNKRFKVQDKTHLQTSVMLKLQLELYESVSETKAQRFQKQK